MERSLALGCLGVIHEGLYLYMSAALYLGFESVSSVGIPSWNGFLFFVVVDDLDNYFQSLL